MDQHPIQGGGKGGGEEGGGEEGGEEGGRGEGGEGGGERGGGGGEGGGREREAILLVALCYRNRVNLWLSGLPVAHMRLYLQCIYQLIKMWSNSEMHIPKQGGLQSTVSILFSQTLLL